MKRIVRLTEGDINRLVEKVLMGEQEIINEQLGLVAGIMLFRQTAHSKTNRLIKYIKKALKNNDHGVKSKDFDDGTLRGLIKCVGEFTKQYGDDKHSGRKGMKLLAKKSSKGIFTKERKNTQHKDVMVDFEKDLETRIEGCLGELKFQSSDLGADAKKMAVVFIDTINKFANHTIRL